MSVGPRALPESPPIGREVEATRLAHLIDDTIAGAKRAVVLLGAPGVGKTTLLRWTRECAEMRGCLTASVRIPPAAGLPPRYPVGQLLEGFAKALKLRGLPVPDRLQRVVGTLTGSSSIDAYDVAVPQIADALEEIGRRGPLAIVIDDYHWTPPEGVELLIAALRVVETQVCFIASARLRGLGEEAAATLPEPSADLWVEHLEVRGLEASAVATLAAVILGGDVLPSLTDAVYARTFGNPLFIVETLQSWRVDGALALTGGYWGLDPDVTPRYARSLREMISARLARLDNEALSVARTLAAIGRDADFDEVARVSGLPQDILIGIIDRLIDDGLLAFDPQPAPRYRLAHPLYGAALSDEEGTPGRASLHGTIYRELLARSRTGRSISAAELAHHAVRALTPPEDLRTVLIGAAEEAEAAGSFEEATIWYGHLAENADDPSELARALRGQATAAINADPQRAIGLFTYALGLESTATSRARLLLGRARAHRVAGNPEQALADLDLALPLAAPEEAFDIRHAIGAVNGMLRNLDAAEEIFRSLAEQSAGTTDHSKAIGHLGMVALTRGSIVDGAALMEEALSSCQDESYANYLRNNLSWILAVLGRWNDSSTTIKQALRLAVGSGDISLECSLLGIDGRLASWQGDLARAFDRATRSRRLAVRLGNAADVIQATDSLAGALIENGMYEEAAAMLGEVLALDGPTTEERELSYTYAVFANACVLAQDIPRARTAIERARWHLPSGPFWAVAVDRCEAQVDLACDDPVRALGRLRHWIDHPSDIALEQAHVLRVCAEALFASGDRARAVSAGEEAAAAYEGLGAVRMTARMSERLETMRAPRRGRPKTSPGQLTEREAEILRLVVLGRSNQGVAEELFISVATVKKHLENIMAKAGVSRRTELVPFAISVGVLAPEELVAEREAALVRDAGSALGRPARRGGPLSPRQVRPARAKAPHQASESRD